MRKAMYLTGAMEDSDVEWLAANATEQRLTKGQVLVREGQPIDCLFVVLEGHVAVHAGGAQIATLMAGEVVGEISFVDSRPPLATATALDTARILAVRREVLQTKLGSDSIFASNFYRALAVFLADRLRTTTRHMGYWPPQQDAASEDADEMSDDLMETVSLGTRRFDNLLRRVHNG